MLSTMDARCIPHSATSLDRLATSTRRAWESQLIRAFRFELHPPVAAFVGAAVERAGDAF